MTIESKEEQNFLSKLLSSFKRLSDNVWIGLKSINKTYEWIDGNDLTFDNWEEGADKRQDCVIMSITDHSLGKWSDRSCLKKSLSICQKKQMTVNAVKQQLIQMKRLLDKQQKK